LDFFTESERAKDMKKRRLQIGIILMACLAILSLVMVLQIDVSAQRGKTSTPPEPGPMLSDGTIDIDTPDFNLTLVRSTQTVAALKPKGAGGFDFTPGDLLVERSQNGYYHLGDIDLRVRAAGTAEWENYTTAAERKPVAALPVSAGVLAAADLGPALPEACPLQVTRRWSLVDGKLALTFALTNKAQQAVEIGGLGIPMIFNNILTRRSLEQAHAACSFFDPYIGADAGYLQVTRLSGHGPVLVVVPEGRTPFEAYNPIINVATSDTGRSVFFDPMRPSTTFEGFYDWMVCSKAYAETEWKNASPWNLPTSVTLTPGQSKTYGVRFLISPEIREIEQTLIQNRRPVAIGIPGYILPSDMDVRLFLNYPQAVKSISVEPKDAITITGNARTANGWMAYTLRGKTWGTARVAVTYADGLLQTISYRVIKPEAQAVADMGRFLTTSQWFVDPKDPFHRSPSNMSYDRKDNKIVLQDSRVWIAGLGDEGGSGPYLAAAMKLFGQPDVEELNKYQQFIDGVLYGGIYYKDGPMQYGVRKSMLYYAPDAMPAGYYNPGLNWKTWTSWDREQAESVGRSFNYPHVAAAFWSMYRLARNHVGLVTNHPWDWYLKNAYETSLAMTRYASDRRRGLVPFGQMEGDIFLQILLDLQREGWKEQAAKLEADMKARADLWKEQAYPYGSEMPWDSTGQEEVYAWTKYFGYRDKAQVTLDAILAYDPTVPNWGYNGSARRYWDFLYAGYPGVTSRVERQLHHYGSGLNAIPLLSEYRDKPDDFHLLRVGYAGTMGALTDIDQEGFASAAFHAFPSTLRFDYYTGDYGPNFFGHVWNTATYIVNHPEFKWQAFGGNLAVSGNTIRVTPLDSLRMRVYLAPLGLWLTLDAGTFESIEINAAEGTVRAGLSSATTHTPVARLRVEQPAATGGAASLKPVGEYKSERGAFVVPLTGSITWVEIR
jgi:hypothetical protein